MNQFDERHWKFSRTCPGFRPEPEVSAGWVWWTAGAALALFFLGVLVWN